MAIVCLPQHHLTLILLNCSMSVVLESSIKGGQASNYAHSCLSLAFLIKINTKYPSQKSVVPESSAKFDSSQLANVS